MTTLGSRSVLVKPLRTKLALWIAPWIGAEYRAAVARAMERHIRQHEEILAEQKMRLVEGEFRPLSRDVRPVPKKGEKS